MGSRHFWVYINIFRGSLIDCEHFRSVVLKLWTRKESMNTQQDIFLDWYASCPYKARVPDPENSEKTWKLWFFRTRALYGHDTDFDKNVNFCVFIGSFRVHTFKTTLRKCSQSIRQPRNRFTYTLNFLEPIARRRFFYWTPNEGYSILYSSILGWPSF